MTITNNEPQYFIIWGAICEDLADAQIVWERWATAAEANAKLEDLNNTNNHPDLAYWLEEGDIDHMLECGIEGE